ncbi:tetratricopeptide repeat protein [bacterium]|nr:MAG: tetratricopeptide repeat protein [bacterium]
MAQSPTPSPSSSPTTTPNPSVPTPRGLAALRSRFSPSGALNRYRNGLALFLCTLVTLLVAVMLFRLYRQPLSTEAMDYAQVARNIAQGKGFTTSVIYPFAAPLSANKGFFPDLLHEPLFPLLASVAFVATSPGDSVMTILSLLFFVVSVSLLFSLATRLSGGNLAVASTTAAIYTLSSSVLGLATSGTPATLSTALLLLLLLILTPRLPRVETPATATATSDKPAKKKKKAKQRSSQSLAARRFFWAGIVLGLCFLSNYMLILPATVLAWFWVADQLEGWNRDTIRSFALGFALASLPWLIRNFRLTGNPFYTLQWFELAMQTKAFPGQSLLSDFDQGRSGSLVSFGPGFGEVLRKTLRGLQDYFHSLPEVPNPYLMPFVLVALGLRSRFLQVERCRVKAGLFTSLFVFIVILSVLGRRDTTYIAPFVPLLTFIGASALVELFTLWSEQGLNPRSADGRIWWSLSGAAAFNRARVLAIAVLLFLLIFPLAPIVSSLASGNSGAATRAAALKKMGEALPAKRAVISDIPEEIAWYSNRPSLLVPAEVKQLSELNQSQAISSVFLSRGVVAPGSVTPDVWKQIYNGKTELKGYVQSLISQQGDQIFLKNPTIAEAQSTVKRKPKDAEAQLALGYALLEANRIAPARQAFVQASRLNPNWPQAFLARGESALKLGQFDTALSDFSSALALAPRSLSAQLGRGDALLAKGRGLEAITAYEKVLADYPEQLTAVNNLAYLYAQQGKNLNRALEMGRRAVQLSPGNAEVIDTLGWTCTLSGRHQEAVALLTQAVSMMPNNGLTLYHLGKAQLALGQKQDGYGSLQKALTLTLPPSEKADAQRVVAAR